MCQAKQKAMEELTPGQAAVMARNEQQMEKVAEEMEDLEEVLTDSISDSIRGKRQKAEAEAAPTKPKRRCDISPPPPPTNCLSPFSSRYP